MVRRLALISAVGTVAWLASAGFAAPALASGFEVPTVGNSQSGPVTADASAVYWNPAQLANMDSARLEAGAQFIVGRASYQRNRRGTYQSEDGLELEEPVPNELLDPSKTGVAKKVTDTPIAAAGSLFAAGPVYKDRLWIGGGLYAPYAALLSFPQNGPQRFQHTGVTLIQAQAELAIAAKLHERVSIGAGVSYVSTILEFARVQDFGALDLFADALANPPLNQSNSLGADAPSTVRELDTLGRPIWVQRGLSHGVTFNAGMAFKPKDNLDIGINYQHSNSVVARGNFTLDMNDPFFTEDLEAQGLDFEPTVKGKATIRVTLPKKLTLGVGGFIGDRWWIHGSIAYAFWSDFESFDLTLVSDGLAQPDLGLGRKQVAEIPKNFNDAIDVRINGRMSVSDKIALNAGLGYASPAAPEETIDAVTPDGHHLTWAAGISVQVKPRLELLLDAQGNHILPRTVTNSDYDLANGEYRLFIGALGAHLRVAIGKPVTKTTKSTRGKGKANEAPTGPSEAPAAEPTPTEPQPDDPTGDPPNADVPEVPANLPADGGANTPPPPPP